MVNISLSYVAEVLMGKLLFEWCRKRPADDAASEFDPAMRVVFDILINYSRDFLSRSGTNAGAIDESEFECAEYICESMVSLGSTNLGCIAGDDNVLSLYLQQVSTLTS